MGRSTGGTGATGTAVLAATTAGCRGGGCKMHGGKDKTFGNQGAYQQPGAHDSGHNRIKLAEANQEDFFAIIGVGPGEYAGDQQNRSGQQRGYRN